MPYKIVRFYKNSYRRRTIKKGLTREAAVAHCQDPETSSATCTRSDRKAITRRNGPWFDAFEIE